MFVATYLLGRLFDKTLIAEAWSLGREQAGGTIEPIPPAWFARLGREEPPAYSLMRMFVPGVSWQGPWLPPVGMMPSEYLRRIPAQICSSPPSPWRPTCLRPIPRMSTVWPGIPRSGGSWPPAVMMENWPSGNISHLKASEPPWLWTESWFPRKCHKTFPAPERTQRSIPDLPLTWPSSMQTWVEVQATEPLTPSPPLTRSLW